jgi:hypothetical protein
LGGVITGRAGSSEGGTRAKRAKIFAKGAITGWQIVVPHYPGVLLFGSGWWRFQLLSHSNDFAIKIITNLLEAFFGLQ